MIIDGIALDGGGPRRLSRDQQRCTGQKQREQAEKRCAQASAPSAVWTLDAAERWATAFARGGGLHQNPLPKVACE